VRDARQWWEAVCEAARRMDFAWVSLKTLHPDGRIEEEIWRASEPKPGMSRLVTVTIPLAAGNGDPPRRFEIAIWANGSLEAANRRATLFGRLIDEHSLAALRPEMHEAVPIRG